MNVAGIEFGEGLTTQEAWNVLWEAETEFRKHANFNWGTGRLEWVVRRMNGIAVAHGGVEWAERGGGG